MKLKKILPILTISALPISAVSLASCGPENKVLGTLSWDFVEQSSYTSVVEPEALYTTYKIDEAISHYLVDVRSNPMIMLDDIMLHEDFLYKEMCNEYTVIEYKDQLNLIDVNVEKCTVSFSFLQEIELASKENPNDSLGKTTTSLKYLNIPYISKFTYEPSDTITSPDALSRWEFVPEFTEIKSGRKTDFINYFKSIEGWSLQGSVTSEDSSNENISFDFNRDNIDSMTDAQFLYFLKDAFYNLWSHYYERVSPGADFIAEYNSTSFTMACNADRELKYPNSYVLYINMDDFIDESKIGTGWKLHADSSGSKNNSDSKSLQYDCIGSINRMYFKQTDITGLLTCTDISVTKNTVLNLIIMPKRDSGMSEQDVVHFEFTPSAE